MSNISDDLEVIYGGHKKLSPKEILDLYNTAVQLKKYDKILTADFIADATQTAIDHGDGLIADLLPVLLKTLQETDGKGSELLIQKIQQHIDVHKQRHALISIKPTDRPLIMKHLQPFVKALAAAIDSKYPRATTGGRKEFCSKIKITYANGKIKHGFSEQALSRMLNRHILPNESTLKAIFDALGMNEINLKLTTHGS